MRQQFFERQFLDRTSLFELLNTWQLPELVDAVERNCRRKFDNATHGNLDGWRNAWEQLPNVDANFDCHSDAVRIVAQSLVSEPAYDPNELKKTLMQFHPWRKGPWEIFGVPIDTEWRSNLKWDRLKSHVDFRNRRVLDVGSGNGYYGWRMLQAGASAVIGCEPFMLSVAQFEVVRKYWIDQERHWVVPLADTDLPRELRSFDVTLSMGVLYHRPNPIDHLQILHGTLKPRGTLILETIVLDRAVRQPTSSSPTSTPAKLPEFDRARLDVLVPEDRYAKMRNVWFIPTVAMLERWLRRTGFVEIELLDLTETSANEQRRTEWMHFESLSEFLDPADYRRTIEGYPAPTRAVLKARVV